MRTSRCVICAKAFKEGDSLQAFLKSPDDLKGSWTESFPVDKEYQERAKTCMDSVKRKHAGCEVGQV